MFLSALLLTGAVALAPSDPSTTTEPTAPAKSNPATDAGTKDDAKAAPDAPEAGAATSEQPQGSALMRPFEAVVVPTREAVVTQTCDALRTPTTESPASLRCTAWRVEFSSKGKVWGSLEADSLDALQRKRARHLAFVRQYARVFDKAVDSRYEDASDAICDQCDPAVARGRWGEGQTFSGLESARALESARQGLAEFERVFFETHAPGVTEVARLAGERKTASTAKRYAKQLELAAGDLVAWQAQLDQAALLRSEAKVKKVAAAMKSRGNALDKGLAALSKQVSTTVSKAHAGRYTEEGSTAAALPVLEVKFDGAAVTATYKIGEATSVWFEGKVALDGSIAGRSLMAPPEGALSCTEHTEACGYRYIPAIIRFSVRAEPKTEVLELWFQRQTWVRANPFSRAG